MEQEYKVVSDLTEEEGRDLAEFLGSRMDTPILERLIETRSEPVGVMYRGIKYRKDRLYVGAEYNHWYNLSSWSKDKAIALGFTFEDYVPEGYYEDMYEEWYGEYVELGEIKREVFNQINDTIRKVLFVLEDGYGFTVGNHLEHDRFKDEQEVINYMGSWTITSLEESKNDKGELYTIARLSPKIKKE
ncbi:hypothetical protein IMZ31_24090 (plasmid) [Pontibacillus sp. ALD_SL1]|uniref:hypothetical protein n=1 Tax=Pontibacillus sp. ALD_SL1 TaxID=2777185 RepID=UPI001A972621|nr:hypothetical protein [Pontibacillus sp. ALD_SL1]QST02533.1 hypothetical protein IMZ31_24090 [Pontibacillus sp. ALD_SL1]